MGRDVTELLRVDPELAGTDSVERAVAMIGQRMVATVASDTDAKAVLVELGLTEDEAADQVRVSYGPMA